RHQRTTVMSGQRSRPRVVFTSSTRPVRGGAQDGADLRLEILLPIRRSVLRPVALRIVEVRERLEGLAALDHGQDLSEVVPACRSKVDTRTFPQLARVDRLAAELDAVDRTQNVVEASRPKNRRR